MSEGTTAEFGERVATGYITGDNDTLCDTDDYRVDPDPDEEGSNSATNSSGSSLGLPTDILVVESFTTSACSTSAGTFGSSGSSFATLATKGYVSDRISRILPSPTCEVWNRIPSTCLTEFPELGDLEMDTGMNTISLTRE